MSADGWACRFAQALERVARDPRIDALLRVAVTP